mmetsp:Transcript_107513/g.272833  ORF Transcript_107513/g.272833 Transcript_107513/m.272833 type:complete len:384 (-) Transcript_107513:117-1268(-)
MVRYAAVEGGGTTFVVCIGEERLGEPTCILERVEFPTRTPSETLSAVASWLSARQYDALGVAMFGPIDLDQSSATWGWITTTPKPGWQNTNVMGPLMAVRTVPCGFDTDVNAPALEEFRHFARPGETSCAYVTVGTGIGVGLVVNGRCVRGLVHPEGGHIPTLKRRAGDSFRGVDKMHPWCVEAQCSAVALAERAGVSQAELKDLPDDSEVWQDAAYMLGALCATLCALLSVERIVLGGGVMLQKSLFPKVRLATREILNGYISHPKVLQDGPDGIDGYIVPSVRGNDAGVFGALALASDAYKQAGRVGKRASPSSVESTAIPGESSEDSMSEEVRQVRERRRDSSAGYGVGHVGAAFLGGALIATLGAAALLAVGGARRRGL